jgi:cell division protein FtsZ
MESIYTSRFSFDAEPDKKAKLAVVGVGGGGGNALNNMIRKGINGVEFVAINTDAQALEANLAPRRIQTGRELTKGLGAGARPVVGAEAAEESRAEIEKALGGCDMVFITAGMGGGTGTGGAPVVASIARKLGILTVAIVTKPFDCEGRKRSKSAHEGLDLLRESVDTLIIVPNERLLDIADADTSLIEAFEMADDVLYNATRGISDLITEHGLINLDFADVRTTMADGGTALMGSATASGERRAERAAMEAISSPLLDGISINGARNVLVNITAGESLGIREATQATAVIQREAGDDAEVIFGTVIDSGMGDEIRITVIATGFETERRQAAAPVRRTVRLDEDASVPQYKGEDNLRRLDQPAYERRTPALPPEPRTEPRMEPRAERSVDFEAEERARQAKLRRVHPEDFKHRRERIRKDDSDVPAFLRKMMD